MRAVVLCAGLGTRLRPLTNDWPKPAIPLLGQPLLRYSLALLRRAGVDWVGINTHHLPSLMEKVATAECRRSGIALELIHEPAIQGTGGGIRGFQKRLQDDVFLVVNGDILFSFELAPLVDSHRRSGAVATMVLMAIPAGERYAAVETDREGRIWRIAGRGVAHEQIQARHFTGIHLLAPAVFDFMSAAVPEEINRDVYPRVLRRGGVVHGETVEGYWSDLGTAGRYLKTQADLLWGRVPLPDAQASPFAQARQGPERCWSRGQVQLEGVELEGPAFLDEGCRIFPPSTAGPEVYLGAAAQVGPDCKLAHAAVLDGTSLRSGESLVNGIAWGSQRLLQSR